jgi:hypothetical protein
VVVAVVVIIAEQRGVQLARQAVGPAQWQPTAIVEGVAAVCGRPANACTPTAAPVLAQWTIVMHAHGFAARAHNVVVVACAPHVVAAACGQAPATVLSVAAAPVEGIAAGTPSDRDHAGAAAVSVVIVPSTTATSANRTKDVRGRLRRHSGHTCAPDSAAVTVQGSVRIVDPTVARS